MYTPPRYGLENASQTRIQRHELISTRKVKQIIWKVSRGLVPIFDEFNTFIGFSKATVTKFHYICPKTAYTNLMNVPWNSDLNKWIDVTHPLNTVMISDQLYGRINSVTTELLTNLQMEFEMAVREGYKGDFAMFQRESYKTGIPLWENSFDLALHTINGVLLKRGIEEGLITTGIKGDLSQEYIHQINQCFHSMPKDTKREISNLFTQALEMEQ